MIFNKTIRSIFSALLLSLLIIFCTFGASAEVEPINAPGGQVSSIEEFYVAMGGQNTCIIREDGIFISSDIILEQPVVFASGEYSLDGGGCVISTENDSELFILESGASLSIGNSTSVGTGESVILTGNKRTAKSLISVSSDSTLTLLAGSKLTSNISSTDGGAIYSDGKIIMGGGKITECRAINNGGAIYATNELNLFGGTITDCSAKNGGAVYASDSSTLSLGGTELKNLSAENGGAVFSAGVFNFVTSAITYARAENGGAVYITGTSTLLGGQITNSTASSFGGAIYNSGKVELSYFYISDCSAKNGGGIYNSGDFDINSGTFSTSEASENGGNIYNDGTLKLIEGSLSSGSAKLGGGVFNAGRFEYSGGGFLLLKADYGKAVFNVGVFAFTEYPYIDPKYDVCTAVNIDNCTVELNSELSASFIAQIIPCVYDENGVSLKYEEGVSPFVGDYVSYNSSRFTAGTYDGHDWIYENGMLVSVKKMVEQPLFYIIIASVYVGLIVLFVFLFSYFDKIKRKNEK